MWVGLSCRFNVLRRGRCVEDVSTADVHASEPHHRVPIVNSIKVLLARIIRDTGARRSDSAQLPRPRLKTPNASRIPWLKDERTVGSMVWIKNYCGPKGFRMNSREAGIQISSVPIDRGKPTGLLSENSDPSGRPLGNG